jgi:ribosome-binding factor A
MIFLNFEFLFFQKKKIEKKIKNPRLSKIKISEIDMSSDYKYVLYNYTRMLHNKTWVKTLTPDIL